MITLTDRKRRDYPARYARKDARTLIYRALYGRPEPGKRSNDPTNDDHRHLPFHWTYQAAESAFKDNIDAALLTAAQRAHLERRLETLRHHKPNA